MPRGSRLYQQAPEAITAKLLALLDVAYCIVLDEGEGKYVFTETAGGREESVLLPKSGVFYISAHEGGTRLRYEVGVVWYLYVWISFLALLCAFAVVPLLVAYWWLYVLPQRFMDSVLEKL